MDSVDWSYAPGPGAFEPELPHLWNSHIVLNDAGLCVCLMYAV